MKQLHSLFALFTAVCCLAFAPQAKAETLQLNITVGEKSFVVPAPSEHFVEMSAPLALQVKASLPGSNRFLCGFTDPQDATMITSATIQSIVPLEAQSLTKEDFALIVAQSKAMLGSDSFNDEFDKAIESADGLKGVDIGQPKVLGALQEAPDRFVYAMVIVLSGPDGKAIPLLIGSSMVHLHGKLVMQTLTVPFDGEQSLEALKPRMLVWVQALIDSNS
ncbi:MAG: hypothetical protein JW739_02715 [Opitutales bacterium]|nr:hypothetical protein [Opitutales bacterium]